MVFEAEASREEIRQVVSRSPAPFPFPFPSPPLSIPHKFSDKPVGAGREGQIQCEGEVPRLPPTNTTLRTLDLRSTGCGLESGLTAAECNPGQVLNTHVFLLSPSSIIWYQPMGGDALRPAGRVTVGLASHWP